jgi:hypothetical protein
MGDPAFNINGPTSGSTVGPTFSVTGSGPKNMQNLAATVGGTTNPAAQENDDFYWEAIFTGMLGGTYNVSASYANGTTPATPITFTVNDAPGLTINAPILITPMMATATGNSGQFWSDWEVTGTSDTTKVSEVQIFLTNRGRDVDATAGKKATKKATIDALGNWTCKLDFVPPGYRGQGFLVHYRATQIPSGKNIWGTCPQTFSGPS